MNAFGNMKDIYKMQKEAKAMQKKLREQIVSGESKDKLVTIVMNGAKEFEDIKIDDQLLDPTQMERLKKSMKQAFKDLDKKLQKEMAKNVDMDSLKGMFGG